MRTNKFRRTCWWFDIYKSETEEDSFEIRLMASD